MNEILTVSNMFSAIICVIGFSIKQELTHIRQGIEEAKASANEAHKRLDTFLTR